MRKITTLLVSLVCLAAVAAQPAPPVEDYSVYVTKSGKKYHKDTCSSVSKSKIEMKKSEAEKKGYTPCKNCKP